MEKTGKERQLAEA